MSFAPALPAFDPRALGVLRHKAATDASGSLRAVAREFESLFLELLLKNLRATALQGGLFDSEATHLYRELADQQLARVIAGSGRGIGLADQLAARLAQPAPATPVSPGEPLPLQPAALPLAHKEARSPIPLKARLPGSDMMPLNPSPRETAPKAFVAAVWEPAVAAAREIGVPPAFLVAQAALESGWGRREIRFPDGRQSYNLFGIKAGADWTGPTVEIPTTEYENGVRVMRHARFRAYSSYREAFADYARLIRQSPRYQAVAGAVDFPAFAQALQQAGYATDPAYAEKLTRLMTSNLFREAMA